MYAIIKTGSKQIRVQKGDVIDVERLSSTESTIQFQDILLVNDGQATHIDPAHLKKFHVSGQFLQEVKAPKVIAYKYKKCKNSRRTVGHRQKYSRVKITEIAQI